MSGVGERQRERSIVAEARALRAQCAHGGTDAVGSAPPASKPASLDEARAERREFYVLCGVCAERVIGDFIAIVPPSEVPSLDRSTPGLTASASFADLLQRTFERFFAEHTYQWRDGQQATDIGPLLARIDQLGPQSSAVLDRPCFHYAERLLHGGMRSIAPVAPGVLSAIVELADRAGADTTPTEIVEIAYRSVRLPLQLAALGLRDSSRVQFRLIDKDKVQLDLSAVRLAGPRGRERLELTTPDVALDPGTLREPELPPTYDYTIGCPSILQLGSTPVLEQLWRWTVEAAVQCGYLDAVLEQVGPPAL